MNINLLLKITVITSLTIYTNWSHAEIVPHGVCRDVVAAYIGNAEVMDVDIGDTVDVSSLNQYKCKAAAPGELNAESLTCIYKDNSRFLLKAWVGPVWTQWVPSHDGTSYTCRSQFASGSNPNQVDIQQKQQTRKKIEVIKIVKKQGDATGKLEETNLGWHQGAYSCSIREGLHLTHIYTNYYPVDYGTQIVTSDFTCDILANGKTLVCHFPYQHMADYGDLQLLMGVCLGNKWVAQPEQVYMCSE